MISQNISSNPLEWQGSKPQKFKGGRRHDNHPLDQLDNFLIGSQDKSKLLGPSKKRFQILITIGTDEPPRPHIRPNINRTQSNVTFQMLRKNSKNNERLMLIPPIEHENSNNSVLFRNRQLGQSKMKNLQNGQLKTGIYRNFYRSQFNNDLIR